MDTFSGLVTTFAPFLSLAGVAIAGYNYWVGAQVSLGHRTHETEDLTQKHNELNHLYQGNNGHQLMLHASLLSLAPIYRDRFCCHLDS
jgi:hypothetical protein